MVGDGVEVEFESILDSSGVDVVPVHINVFEVGHMGATELVSRVAASGVLGRSTKVGLVLGDGESLDVEILGSATGMDVSSVLDVSTVLVKGGDGATGVLTGDVHHEIEVDSVTGVVYVHSGLHVVIGMVLVKHEVLRSGSRLMCHTGGGRAVSVLNNLGEVGSVVEVEAGKTVRIGGGSFGDVSVNTEGSLDLNGDAFEGGTSLTISNSDSDDSFIELLILDSGGVSVSQNLTVLSEESNLSDVDLSTSVFGDQGIDSVGEEDVRGVLDVDLDGDLLGSEEGDIGDLEASVGGVDSSGVSNLLSVLVGGHRDGGTVVGMLGAGGGVLVVENSLKYGVTSGGERDLDFAVTGTSLGRGESGKTGLTVISSSTHRSRGGLGGLEALVINISGFNLTERDVGVGRLARVDGVELEGVKSLLNGGLGAVEVLVRSSAHSAAGEEGESGVAGTFLYS